MRFPPGTFEARFVARPNRFVSFVERDGEVLRCFCPDPGRLAEFTTPGRPVLVAPAEPGSTRATAYTHLAFHHDGEWACLLTANANGLAREAWEAGLLPEIPAGSAWRAEVKHGASRFDYLIRKPDGRELLLEVKSATLVEDGVARFPDAPTVRGARHVRELTEHVREGGEAMVLFMVQRESPRALQAHKARDPAFAEALEEARSAGVTVSAVACVVTPSGVTPGRRLPVIAPPI